MSDGVTRTGDVFGAGCASLPKESGNEGSLDGMVDDPVATAAGNNPLLTKLVTAVKAAGLVDTLNKTDAKYTVFAPYDPAFEALGQDALNAVLSDKPKLTTILTYHVVPQRMDRDDILATATLPTAQGGTLKVAGSGDNVTVNGSKVLCGNIPTANATVFVIDKVLMP
ncbi:fasciclin domain-containing protein [Saccharothrix obliqua]|uniref:fasciclin domain-containing protein n=1 Tax=Saccharothrix obliqua TaxID=2861747 RepID=UPI0027E311A2|nr:fasciclin domain-containing protein [Saccharothrix obliqua]